MARNCTGNADLYTLDTNIKMWSLIIKLIVIAGNGEAQICSSGRHMTVSTYQNSAPTATAVYGGGGLIIYK